MLFKVLLTFREILGNSFNIEDYLKFFLTSTKRLHENCEGTLPKCSLKLNAESGIYPSVNI